MSSQMDVMEGGSFSTCEMRYSAGKGDGRMKELQGDEPSSDGA